MTSLAASFRSDPFIYVEDLDTPVFAESDMHHFRRVRRTHDGAAIILSDGRGGWRTARFADVPFELGEVQRVDPPTADVSVGFAPVKGERPEWVVQKLTELGVASIRPFHSSRSVVRWDAAKAQKQVVKWRLVSREAGMQSRHVRLPHIHEVASLQALRSAEPQVAIADPDGEDLTKSDRLVLIGPEGGWESAEVSGLRRIRLPGGVLRAETAAIVAGALLVERLGDEIFPST